jgi:hypothetical protein
MDPEIYQLHILLAAAERRQKNWCNRHSLLGENGQPFRRKLMTGLET